MQQTHQVVCGFHLYNLYLVLMGNKLYDEFTLYLPPDLNHEKGIEGNTEMLYCFYRLHC